MRHTESFLTEIKNVLKGNPALPELILGNAIQAGFSDEQINQLREKIKDLTKDQYNSTEGLAASTQQQPAATQAKPEADESASVSPAKPAAPAPAPESQTPESVCMELFRQMFETLSPLVRNGSVKPEEISSIFTTPNPVTGSLGEQEIITKIQDFTKAVAKETVPAKIKEAYNKLPPQVQAAISKNSKDFVTALTNDPTELIAGMIQHDKAILSAFNKAKASTQSSSQSSNFESQRKFTAECGRALEQYRTDLNNLAGYSEAARPAGLKAAQDKLIEGFRDAMYGASQGDIAWLQEQMKTARKPEQLAKETNGFLNQMQKLLSGKAGITLTLIALPIIAKLLSYVPIIGPTISGLTQSVLSFAGQIGGMSNGLSGLIGNPQNN